MLRLLKNNYILIVILILGLFLRLNVFQYQFYDVDQSRNLTISSHLAKYGELPVQGPENAFSNIPNSTFYYYFLATLFYLGKSDIFVNFVNLIFQISNILLVYSIGKKLFSKSTGIISAFVVCICRITIIASSAPYEPYFVTFFFLLSMWFLVSAFESESFTNLLFGEIFFVISGAVHMSAFLTAPIFFYLILATFRKWKYSYKYYIFALVVLLTSTTILFGSFLSGILNSPYQTFPYLTTSFEQFANNFYLISINFLNSIFSLRAKNTFGIPTIFFGTIVLIRIFLQNNKLKTNVYRLMIIEIFLYISMVAAIGGQKHSELIFTEHRFYPAYFICIIIIAESINGLCEYLKISGIIKTFLIIALIPLLIHQVSFDTSSAFRQDQEFRDVWGGIKEETQYLYPNEKIPRSFQVKVYEYSLAYDNKWERSPWEDFLIWYPLENYYDTKFIKLRQLGYSDLNNNDFIFVMCLNNSEAVYSEQPCLDAFGRGQTNHTIVKKVIERNRLHLYLAKRGTVENYSGK